MNVRTILYRVFAWVCHQLTAWNTGGEGIHSPYLFHLVHHVIRDVHHYYCWSEIEQRRSAMLSAPKLVTVQDYGSKGKGKSYTSLVNKIAKHSLQSASNAQLFFCIVHWLSHEQKRPLHIVELGTNLGITTAYLAMANSGNEVETFEGSTELLKIAEQNWQKLDIHNIVAIEGNIDNTLFSRADKPVDIAYMDANHRLEPTLRYFNKLASKTNEKSIIILDDIHYSQEMERAWRIIQQHIDVTTTMDFFHFGLVFFDPHYLKKHYILRG